MAKRSWMATSQNLKSEKSEGCIDERISWQFGVQIFNYFTAFNSSCFHEFAFIDLCFKIIHVPSFVISSSFFDSFYPLSFLPPLFSSSFCPLRSGDRNGLQFYLPFCDSCLLSVVCCCSCSLGRTKIGISQPCAV